MDLSGLGRHPQVRRATSWYAAAGPPAAAPAPTPRVTPPPTTPGPAPPARRGARVQRRVHGRPDRVQGLTRPPEPTACSTARPTAPGSARRTGRRPSVPGGPACRRTVKNFTRSGTPSRRAHRPPRCSAWSAGPGSPPPRPRSPQPQERARGLVGRHGRRGQSSSRLAVAGAASARSRAAAAPSTEPGWRSLGHGASRGAARPPRRLEPDQRLSATGRAPPGAWQGRRRRSSPVQRGQAHGPGAAGAGQNEANAVEPYAGHP